MDSTPTQTQRANECVCVNECRLCDSICMMYDVPCTMSDEDEDAAGDTLRGWGDREDYSMFWITNLLGSLDRFAWRAV